MSNPTIPVKHSGDSVDEHGDATVVTMASKAPDHEPTTTAVDDSDIEEVEDRGPPKYLFNIQLNCGGCQKGVERKLESKKKDANDAFEYEVRLDKENGSTVKFWGDIEKDEADAMLKETKKEYSFVEPKKKGCCGGGCCSKK